MSTDHSSSRDLKIALGLSLILILLFYKWITVIVSNLTIWLIFIDFFIAILILTILPLNKYFINQRFALLFVVNSQILRLGRILFYIFLGEVLSSGFQSIFYLVILLLVSLGLIFYVIINSLEIPIVQNISKDTVHHYSKYIILYLLGILIMLNIILNFYHLNSINSWQEGQNGLISSWIIKHQSWFIPRYLDDIDNQVKVLIISPFLFWVQSLGILIFGYTTIALILFTGILTSFIVIAGFSIHYKNDSGKNITKSNVNNKNRKILTRNQILGVLTSLFLVLDWLIVFYSRTNLIEPLIGTLSILTIVSGVNTIEHGFNQNYGMFKKYLLFNLVVCSLNLFIGGLITLFFFIPLIALLIYRYYNLNKIIGLNQDFQTKSKKIILIWISIVFTSLILFFVWNIMLNLIILQQELILWKPIEIYTVETNLLTNYWPFIIIPVLLLFPFFLLGIYELHSSRNYEKLFFYITWLIITLILMGLFDHAIGYLGFSFIFLYYSISAYGLYWTFYITKSRFIFQNNFEKLLISLPLWMVLMLLQIPFIFEELNLEMIIRRIQNEILLNFFFISVLFFIIIYFVRSVPELISILVSCGTIGYVLFDKKIQLIDSEILIMIMIVIILILYQLRDNIPQKSLIILFVIFFTASLPTVNFIKERNTEDLSYESIATFILSHGGKMNGSTWIFGEPGARLVLQYYMEGIIPVNYGNYGNFPFNANSSWVLEDYIIKRPQLKFFVILVQSRWQNIVPQSTFIEPFDWLQSNYVWVNPSDSSSIFLFANKSVFN